MISFISADKISFLKFLESFPGMEPRPFRRISSLFRLAGCRTIIQEISDINTDTTADLGKQKDDIVCYFKNLSLYGITLKNKKRQSLYFFRSRIGNLDDLNQSEDNQLLGYVIIDQDFFVDDKTGNEYTRSYISESMVPQPLELTNSIFSQEFFINVANKSFTGTGSLFLQQNAITNNSAHIAIRMALSNVGCEISTESINKAINVDHVHKKGNQGLTCSEMQHAIKVLSNAEPFFLHSNSFFSDFELFRSIYVALEFGFPVILLFMVGDSRNPLGHAVSLSGFTMQPNSWWPLASNYYYSKDSCDRKNYLYSYMWCDSFILHDENFGPFHYLPVNAGCKKITPVNKRKNIFSTLQSIIKDTKDPLENVSAIIVSPKGFSDKWAQIMSIEDSAWASLELYVQSLEETSSLPDSSTFRELFYRNFKERLMILKPVCMDREEYFEFQKHDNINEIIVEHLPVNLLIIELSTPELFMQNQRRIGEIVFSFDLIDKSFLDALLMIKLPNITSFFQERTFVNHFEDYSDWGSPTLRSRNYKMQNVKQKT